MPRTGRPPTPFRERFFQKVTPGAPDECWEWQGAGSKREERPYGLIRAEGGRGSRNLQAHRASWEIANGPVPDGMWVLHACANARCVNPGHLYLGTATENNRDTVRHGHHHGWLTNRGGRPRSRREKAA